MTDFMIPITLPKFTTISTDEKVIVMQEAIKKNADIYYRNYMLEKDKLFTKEVFKNLDTEVLKVIRQNITQELHNRKRRKQ